MTANTYKNWIAALLFSGALFVPAATASTIGFNGDYDYATWTASSNIPGPATTVRTIDDSQQTLTLYEPDGADFDGPVQAGEFDFSHTVSVTGMVSFDWTFNWDIDACCSGFGFYINSSLYQLAFDGNASGSFSAPVTAGDTITFAAFTDDNCCQSANTVITNFAATSNTPEPGSAFLVAAGLAGLGFWRRNFFARSSNPNSRV